ncbi:MAG: hypothetical protein ACE5HO_05910 [bacterium]
MNFTTKKRVLWFLLGTFSLWFVGCGSSQDENKGSVELDACSLLAAANPESILGEPVGEPHSTLQQHDADMAVSRCGVAAQSSYLRTLSLQVNYYRKYDNPKTVNDFLGSQNLNYAGVKFTPHEVSGLGDLAVSLSSPGSFQLWVFWKKHYRMNISLTEFGDQALALEKARAVAQQVMSKL